MLQNQVHNQRPSAAYLVRCGGHSATLTTVGYGDTYPITVIGKLLVSMVALLGISVVALPAGIIAANFSRQLENLKGKNEHL